MNDIIERITSTFFPYHREPERSDPDLWRLIAEVQIREIEFYILTGDEPHMAKELADLAFVAIDGLSKMGYDVRQLFTDRLAEIRQKDMTDRNKAYYKDKLLLFETKLQDLKLNGKKPS